MAHFAELDSDNKVIRVVVISNEDVDANGGDLHPDAETFVASIVPHSENGVAWKQTSYHHNFRKQYAGTIHYYDNRRWIGRTFDHTTDPVTETDYVWNNSTSQWEEV